MRHISYNICKTFLSLNIIGESGFLCNYSSRDDSHRHKITMPTLNNFLPITYSLVKGSIKQSTRQYLQNNESYRVTRKFPTACASLEELFLLNVDAAKYFAKLRHNQISAKRLHSGQHRQLACCFIYGILFASNAIKSKRVAVGSVRR